MADDQHRMLREIKAAEAIKAGLLAVTDDEDAIRDTIEGETNLHEMVRGMLLSIEDDQLMVDGASARITDLQERKRRFEERIDSKRSLIEQAMLVGEIDKFEMDLATISLRATPQKAIVAEESEIPSEFFAPQPPKLDTKKLTAALKEGQAIPGASLSNGGRTISIRRK